MLPSDLLLHRHREGRVVPRQLAIRPENLALAAELTAHFGAAVGGRRRDLDELLCAWEGEDLAFKVKRGLAHILANDFCTFEIVSPLEPATLRSRVFELGATYGSPPSRANRDALLQRAAADLDTPGRPEPVTAPQVARGLYADLPPQHVLTAFEPPPPEALLHRYNLAQAQGVFYRAYEMTLTAHRNEPGQYKQLFRYVKLFGLMTLIEGDAEHGFTLRVDGPASLFRPSTRYGLAMAKLLPALLHVSRWSLHARLRARPDPEADRANAAGSAGSTYELASAGCTLVSHYPAGREFDSILEEAFATRWAKLDTPWRLEREVDLVPVPGSAIIPDFRLAHPDGRSALLEIVGYWRPEYLRKKFAALRRSGRRDLILAVSERLNLEAAGVDPRGFGPERLVWFKGKLEPRAVLACVEAVAV